MFLKKIEELPFQIIDFIREVGRCADQKGNCVFLVGGFVRDLLLNVKNFDMDFVVEGDGIGFATCLAEKFSLKIIKHRRFGTAALSGLKGFKVDVVSARKEIYAFPGALPIVSFGTIADDLFRRDFSINAMAIGIHARGFGEIIDVHKGRDDLKKGLIRALHALSFMDDPTRILRAVRFEQRFGFRIEKETRSWIQDAVRLKMLHQVQKHRLRDELVLMFKESKPYRSLRRLQDIAGLSFISPGLRLPARSKLLFDDAAREVSWFQENFTHKKRHLEPHTIFMSLFFYVLPLADLKKTLASFAFCKEESSKVFSLKENFQRVSKELSKKNISPSAVYKLLEPLTYEVILAMVALSKNPLLIQRVEAFLNFYNGQRLHTRGEDLRRYGLSPGPLYKKILSELLYARIDGALHSKEEELELLERLLSRYGHRRSDC